MTVKLIAFCSGADSAVIAPVCTNHRLSALDDPAYFSPSSHNHCSICFIFYDRCQHIASKIFVKNFLQSILILAHIDENSQLLYINKNKRWGTDKASPINYGKMILVIYQRSVKGGKMIELKGKYNTAKVFTDNIDPETVSQIITLLNQDFAKDSKIRIMPDTHAGKGCVIGFTANLGNKVIPNLVGVDIGCGMLTIELGKVALALERLDKIIHRYIPGGPAVHESEIVKFPKLQKLHCYRELKEIKRLERSIGSLGGGNHFIEANTDNEGNVYLVIHTGSRNLGKQVAEYYQNMAIKLRSKAAPADYPRDLCFLEGDWRERYLYDMQLCQEYALLNRETIAQLILNKLLNKDLNDFPSFHTVHNYINFKDNIIRKGSISAYQGEKVLIPINMRDGSLLCVGKGNPDWNFSAPHGAGRIMSRNKAKEKLSLKDYQEAMKGIYTTSVSKATLDEAPMAYKPMEEIMANIQDTVEVIKELQPIYNFKAKE